MGRMQLAAQRGAEALLLAAQRFPEPVRCSSRLDSKQEEHRTRMATPVIGRIPKTKKKSVRIVAENVTSRRSGMTGATVSLKGRSMRI
jgi:hypothetical protein